MAMTEETTERVLIYDISNAKFAETQDEANAIGRGIVARHQAATDRLINTVFKQTFGLDMNEQHNSLCKAVTINGEVFISYRGQAFLAIGEMVEEDHVDGVPLKIYLEYRRM